MKKKCRNEDAAAVVYLLLHINERKIRSLCCVFSILFSRVHNIEQRRKRNDHYISMSITIFSCSRVQKLRKETIILNIPELLLL